MAAKMQPSAEAPHKLRRNSAEAPQKLHRNKSAANLNIKNNITWRLVSGCMSASVSVSVSASLSASVAVCLCKCLCRCLCLCLCDCMCLQVCVCICLLTRMLAKHACVHMWMRECGLQEFSVGLVRGWNYLNLFEIIWIEISFQLWKYLAPYRPADGPILKERARKQRYRRPKRRRGNSRKRRIGDGFESNGHVDCHSIEPKQEATYDNHEAARLENTEGK